MNYQQALDFVQDLCLFGINLGLTRIKNLLKILDNPEQKIKTVHVAGSNGKGSTIAILSSILTEAGYQVGSYTSPHLDSYRERICINGQKISTDKFAFFMGQIKDLIPQVVQNTGEAPTEFEVLTALAFQYFAHARVDVALIEVGLGGRLDSTNVLRPLMSIITPITLDHQQFLGSTIIDIATEKAGIIKEKVPVVMARQETVVADVLIAKARELEAPLVKVADTSWQQLSYGSHGQSFAFHSQGASYPDLDLNLLGDHQMENAATVLLSVEILQSLGWQISEESITQGMTKAYWPGRLEFLAGTRAFLLDGAHNVQGAQALFQAITKYFSEQKIIMVLAILDDKDKSAILEELVPLADQVVVTKVPNTPRNKGWQEIKQLIKAEKTQVFLEEQVTQAIDLAVEKSHPDDLIVITGSLYLLGASRQYVLKKYPPA